MKIVISILVLCVFVLAFYWVLHKHEQAQPATTSRRGAGGGPVTITVATAKKGDLNLYVKGIGNVTPVYTDTITSQVTGFVTDVHFEEGQLVKKGDPLIEIDASPFKATLQQAEGALERDQGILDQAKMDLDRYRAAWAKQAIAKQTLEDQEKIVIQDQGTVKNDQGTVQFDQIQVNYCHITAPIAGRVGLRLVDPGNVVEAAGVQSTGTMPLAVITQVDPITIVFTLPEDSIDLVEAHIHDADKLTVDAFDRAEQKKIGSGVLLTLDNQIDTTTGTVKARATFPNKDAALFPNQFVNARLLVTTYHGVTTIPSSAIQHNGQVAFVYVVENDAVSMRNVTTGITDGDMTQVEGIDPGDVVANSGFEKLQDKSKVVISRESTTQPTTGPSTRPTTRRSHKRDAQ